ncbi:MAG: VTT domain-containing protein [bacterium]|nr:VTT domain-containing protein [bacterium]
MIIEWLYRSKVRLRDLTLAQALRPGAAKWLFFFSVIESSVFPVPPDVLLIPMVLSGHPRPYYLAGLVTVGSVVGGVLGYSVGAIFFETLGVRLVELYSLADEVSQVSVYFDQNAFVAIFLSAFTPIPYKVFTISAGLFHISLVQFIVASLVGRGARFYLEVFVVKRYGKELGQLFFKYFNLISFVFAILILIWVFVR